MDTGEIGTVEMDTGEIGTAGYPRRDIQTRPERTA
ncbi:hypothetical protein C8E95_0611 [Pseudonocardia autotrophica]|uniref:Uncharacterized protein n=1 Tax=Pseudonocardia autotrophica TaxID=2074 RepID=A0A1Y2N7C3_PSEAH|nr:hypothetical protein BG845_00694 [Pseudonocardia autotrophica]TDN71577.1 hypothetical protein C8E95_0611 [Pseudonocardia autotrophica]